jgi:hypothetical protein
MLGVPSDYEVVTVTTVRDDELSGKCKPPMTGIGVIYE